MASANGKETTLNAIHRDFLTRGGVRRSARRALLRALSGAGLASLATGFVTSHAADARKGKRKKKKCKTGKKKCGKRCIDLQRDADNCGGCNLSCAAGEVCVGGACGCPAGQADCGAGCIDVSRNAFNCGACGNACTIRQACRGGFCLTRCDDASASTPFFVCPADPGGVCLSADEVGVCLFIEGNCETFARESCVTDPCPEGRVCARRDCGTDQFTCALPALGDD